MRDATARMVATLRIRQLQKDVNESEEAELRRLEGRAMAGGDGDRLDVPETCVAASGRQLSLSEQQESEDSGAGVGVVGARHRAEQLDSKMFINGGYRDSHKIIRLQPRGAAGLKTKVPKRKNFGADKMLCKIAGP